MTRPLVLITRPEDGARILARMLDERGYDALTDPMLYLHPMPREAMLSMEQAITGKLQATLITSQHALSAVIVYPQLKSLPLFCVGSETAGIAKRHGFRQVMHVPDVHTLLKRILQECRPAEGALLYVRGKEVAYNLAAPLQRHGYAIEEAIVYHMREATAISDGVKTALQNGTLSFATFLSLRTAEVFIKLIQETPFAEALSHVHAVAFSQPIAEKLKALNWKSISVSLHPSLESLLVAVDKLKAED